MKDFLPNGRRALVAELNRRDRLPFVESDPVRLHVGTVLAIVDGKATVELQGRTLEEVPLHGEAAVDDGVYVLFAGNTTLVIGQSGGGTPPPVGPFGEVTVAVAASDANAISKSKADLICTGTNDDVTIQSAFAMLGTAGGKVVLSEGHFHFGTVGVTTPNVNFHLQGAGQGATEIISDTLGTAYQFRLGSTVNQQKQQMVSDLTLHGADKAVSGIVTIQGVNDTVRLENLVIHDFTSHGVSTSARPGGAWKFRRCHFYANGGAGSSGREANVDYIDCIFQSNAGGGLGIQQDSNGHITDCLFWANTGNGITSGNAISQGFSNFIITNNIFLSNTAFGINIQDGDNNLISNNIFQSNTSGSMSFGAGGFGVAFNSLILGNIQIGSATFVSGSNAADQEICSNVINGAMTPPCGGSTVGDLDDLSDVTVTSPVDGQLLVYDSGTSQWVNVPSTSVGTPHVVDPTEPVSPVDGLLWVDPDEVLIAPGETVSLAGLSDVALASPTDGDVLVYDGGEWVNEAGGGGGGSGYFEPAFAPPATPNAADDEFDTDTITSGAWTVVNPSSTFSRAIRNGWLDFGVIGQSNNHGNALLKANTVSIGDHLTVAHRILTIGTGGFFSPVVGPVFANGAVVGSNFAGTLYLGDFRFGGETGAFNAMTNTFPTTQNVRVVGPTIYTRITYVSANTWRTEISVDGFRWSRLNLANYAYTLTPTHIGILISGWSSGAFDTLGAIKFFRKNWNP